MEGTAREGIHFSLHMRSHSEALEGAVNESLSVGQVL